MANFAEEPLVKVTVNLYQADVDWIKERSADNWSDLLRGLIRTQINAVKAMEEAEDDEV